jgi:hypothetical protein
MSFWSRRERGLDNATYPQPTSPTVDRYTFGYDLDAFLDPRTQTQSQSQSQSQPGSHQQSPDPTDESYFYDAFQPTLSPQPTSFLDSILNPIESQNQNPFGYRVESPPRIRRSPIVSIRSNMPPVTRQTQQRPARLANGYVDLTGLSESPEEQRRPTRRPSSTPGPSTKRRKGNHGTKVEQGSATPEATVEEIDLSQDKQDVQDVLQKQREEAVKAQKPEETSTTFATFTCVICMDTPTDLTATSCGMYFPRLWPQHS